MSSDKFHKDDHGMWRWLLGGALLLALIVSAIWIMMDRNNTPMTEDNSAISTETPRPQATSTPTATPTTRPTERPTESPSPESSPEAGDNNTNVTPDVDAVDNKVTLSFKTPVFGHVTKEYAMDHLIYSVTMDYWHTHSGVDIEGSAGTAVKAAADGVVAKAEKDPNLGYVIVLDHGNGWKSTYGNLSSVDNVYLGQLVAGGDVIGTVGDSSPIEYAEAAHLHFELSRDDKTVDPTQYLSGLAK